MAAGTIQFVTSFSKNGQVSLNVSGNGTTAQVAINVLKGVYNVIHSVNKDFIACIGLP